MRSVVRVKNKLSQAQFIVLGFLIIVLISTVLLTLPFASRDGSRTPFSDCLFTSVSATCVTGLVVTDTFTHWSLAGQLIILALIQIGGLGFITIGVIFSVLLRQRIGLKFRGLMQESVNSLKISGIVKLTKKIIKGTLIIEGAGALILGIRFSVYFKNAATGFYYGLWHSVSAFCNAGFDLMGVSEEYASLTGFAGDYLVNIVIMALIIVGGIGFVVWDDISRNGLKFKKYSLHTKIVLVTTAFLIIVPTALFYMTEYNGTMSGMNVGERLLASAFSAVTARTAGFNTVDTGALSGASKMLTMMLMFIGGSPGSTAGGIKTTTIFVLIVNLFAGIRNGRGGSVFKRRFEEDAIRKASTVFILNLVLAVAAIFAVSAVNGLPLEDVAFEVFSAIGTVGMTTGLTRSLNTVSRIIIIILMFCGRIGSLSFAMSIMKTKKRAPVYYPDEKISIG
ncbi:MAG: TrkH family potassium uptake protein [Butyrivibrio sp.]|nr:TrkH family potassium uptake protein [Butyrivibrio sp.]